MRIPAPRDLKCEYLRDPLGVETPRPRLSWVLEHGERGRRQAAYRVIVSSSERKALEGNGDLWDSGAVESDATFGVAYAGGPLESADRCRWRVRWWDDLGSESPFSPPALFGMGLLREKDLRARWITMRRPREFHSRGTVLLGTHRGDYRQFHAVYLRKEFAVEEPFQWATAFVCGLGFCELYINGMRVGDSVLDPAPTDYGKRALYSTYDVTSLLERDNAVGVILGNGRHVEKFGYGPPKLIMQIVIALRNGGREVIVSDGSWQAAHGPLGENGLYYGERYDARLESPGWDRPGFRPEGWEPVEVVGGPPPVSHMMPPAKVECRIQPVNMLSPRPGAFVYDFGRNFSGWVRLRARGPRGAVVTVRHAELLHEDGTINPATNENAEATDVYILGGEGEETWEPRFTYHGFRYAEVTGFPGTPGLDSLEGRFAHSDVERTGAFHCSNELINRIHANVVQGQLCNLIGIPTDCPQRDERHGWLGDAHLAAEQALFNFDMATFYRKFLDDIAAAQREDGSLPDLAPPYWDMLYPADPAWGSAYATIAWLTFLHSGDHEILERHYGGLKRYLEFLRGRADGGIQRDLGKYGDWCPPGGIAPKKTPISLTSTWFYYHDTRLLARFAGTLGREADAEGFESLAAEIKAAFNAEFLRDGEYAALRSSPADRAPSQTSNLLPLYLEMDPESDRAGVLGALLRSVVQLHGCHLDTGIVGTRYLLDVLTENGQAEVAYRVVTQESYPGWGYMLAEGATTLWERWEKIEGGGMNSHNHIMLGSVDAWFYRVLAGISPEAPGWRVVRIAPYPVGDLKHASARVRTVLGDVSVSWYRADEVFSLTARVPVGAGAVVSLPLPWPDAAVEESDRPVWPHAAGRGADAALVVTGMDNGRLRIETGSGFYSFAVRRPRS